MMVFVAVSSVLLTATVLYINEHISSKNIQQEQLKTISDVLSPNLAAALMFNDERTAKELIEPLIGKASVISASVLDIEKLELANSSIQNIEKIIEKESIITLEKNLSFEGTELGKIIIIADNTYVKKRQHVYVSFLAIILFIIITITVLVSYFLSLRFTKPIVKLTKLAKNVSETSNYTLRAVVKGDDEIALLTGYFNEMLHTIETRDTYLENQVDNRTKAISEANKQLEQQAYYDALTELPNRRLFYQHLSEFINQSAIKNSRFTIFFIDLDGFKEINDTLGHDRGDLLLQSVAVRLKACVRKSDFVARLGGDEFTVILPDMENIDAINELAQKLLAKLYQPFCLDNENMFVSGSIGITQYPKDGNDIDKLIRNADQAMYEAKHRGRNQFYHFSDNLEINLQAKKILSNELRLAMSEKQFVYFFQPIINSKTGKIDKFEALLRWQHPQRGIIGPHEFIDTAEELGMVSKISDMMLSPALEHLASWRRIDGCEHLTLSINASPSQFKQNDGWLSRCADKLQQAGLKGSDIMYEITENLVLDLDEDTEDQLRTLREMGVSLAIDDFGTGYSSLSHLQNLNVNVLKIDKCFVDDIDHDHRNYAMCRAMIDMAQQLDLDVVAEGVESIEQQHLLADAGCEFIQGYYYSKPVNADNVVGLLKQFNNAKH